MGYRTTAVEALQGRSLKGTTSVVTGGSSGIGVETVAALAHGGSHVILAARDTGKGERVADEIRSRGVQGTIQVMKLDLEDFQSIRDFAKDLLRQAPRLDFVIFNAGVGTSAAGRLETKEGLEMCFGVNYLGHFLLGRELEGRIKSQATPSRVVVVASYMHTWSKLDLQDLNWQRRKHSPLGTYADSNLARVLFARQLSKRLQGSKATVLALHPGGIRTPISRNSGWAINTLLLLASPTLKTPEQGAGTTVYAAVAPGLEQHSGAYLQDCRIAAPSAKAQDDSLAERLWQASEQLIEEVDSRRNQLTT